MHVHFIVMPGNCRWIKHNSCIIYYLNFDKHDKGHVCLNQIVHEICKLIVKTDTNYMRKNRETPILVCKNEKRQLCALT